VRSEAILEVERLADGPTTIRELRSEAPTRLIPRRSAVPSRDSSITVRTVASAAGPLGGDHLNLRIRIGTGAHLRLIGTGATLALPGPHQEPSTSTVHIQIDPGGTLEFLPDETIICAGADHHTELRADIATDGEFRHREILILGRHAEPPGRLTTGTHITRANQPLLRQALDLTDHRLLASPGYLAGNKVLATEIIVNDRTPPTPSTGDGWSLTPLAAGGVLATALAHDHTTVTSRLTAALDGV